jgi:hypothetical protein
MLKITNINLDEIFKNEIFYFNYIFDSEQKTELNINIAVYDFFSLLINNTNLVIQSNITYYTSFDSTSVSTWNYGFTLVISDNDTNKILFIKTYEPPIRKKNAWLIGDSHTICIPEKELNTLTKYNIKKISFKSLSLNRFLNQDYMKLLSNVNISKMDCLIIYLGEIDIRFTIHKHCKNKNINLEKSFDDLMNRYLNFILEIKKYYNNRIIIMSPNPPLESFQDKKFILGTKNERLLCQNLFQTFWKNKLDIVEYFDWTTDYKLHTGFINPDFLLENDHHISNFTPLINYLEDKL